MLFLALALACSTSTPKQEAAPARASSRPVPAEVKKVDNAAPSSVEGLSAVETESGLSYWVLQAGTGAVPEAGQTVQVHYTGWLTDGTQFDSSHDRGRPYAFPLGRRRVIAGWDEALSTMKIGERRQLRIPPDLAYGSRGMGKVIPPDATLIFDVELVGVM